MVTGDKKHYIDVYRMYQSMTKTLTKRTLPSRVLFYTYRLVLKSQKFEMFNDNLRQNPVLIFCL